MTSNDPMGMFEQIQKMQADMQAAQDALASEVIEATVGGGVVKATVNGEGALLGITIDPSVVDPDRCRDARRSRGGGRPRSDASGQGVAAREARRGHSRSRVARSGRPGSRRPRRTAGLREPFGALRRSGTGLDRRARPLAGCRPEVGATHRVPPPSCRSGRRAPARGGDRRREGARHVVPAVLQHLRRRALRVLPRRSPRQPGVVHRRGAARHRRDRTDR